MSTPSPALSSPPAPAQTPGIFSRIGSALQKAGPYIQPIADHLAAAFGNYAPLENDQQQQALKANQAQSQRQSLMGTYRTIFSDARPEVQPEIAQRMLTIGTTPLRAPLPSSVSDLSSITAPAQQDLQARADQSQQTGVENQDRFGKSFRPTPAPPMTLPPIPGMPAAPNLTSNIPGVTNPNALTGDKMPQPATPRVSLFPTHDEQTQEAAQRAQALARATLTGQIGARDAYLEANPDADPQTAALALGHQMPVGLLRTQNTSTNVKGSEIPSLKTQDGQPVDPSKFYNIVRQGTDSFAVPAGLSANVAQSNIDKNTAAQGELAARTSLEKGRAGMIPLQTQKLIGNQRR